MLGCPEHMATFLISGVFYMFLVMLGMEPRAFHTLCAFPLSHYPNPEFGHVHECIHGYGYAYYVHGGQRPTSGVFCSSLFFIKTESLKEPGAYELY